MNLLSKAADEIGPADIEALVASGLPEGERVEFKRALPTAKGKRDPWEDGGELGDKAKNEILEEVTAFANAYGGVLVLGIEESSDRPAVASAIVPVLRCTELAERFKLVFRDRVEPQLSGLEIFAVPMKGEDGAVLFRAGRSLMAPHRVTKTLVCPVRRADRCEKMTMREIQDMTLNLSRGLERLERRLSERSHRFHDEFDFLSDPDNAYGLRFSAVPANDDIWFDRFFHQGKLIDKFNFGWKSVLVNGQKIRDDLVPSHWRPIIRGARSDYFQNYSVGEKMDFSDYYEMHQDGLIEFGIVSNCNDSNAGYWPNGGYILFGNLVFWSKCLKRLASAINCEYVLEIEIYVKSPTKRVPIRQGLGHLSRNIMTIKPVKFPHYILNSDRTEDEFLSDFYRDFWHLAGVDREAILTIAGV